MSSTTMSSERTIRDRKSVGEGKRVDLGGRRIIKKKKILATFRARCRGQVAATSRVLATSTGCARCRQPAATEDAARRERPGDHRSLFFFKQKTAYEILA